MTKLYVIFAFVVAVALNSASATNLRQHDMNRRLVTMEAIESASTDFFIDEANSSESAIGDGLSTEVEASVYVDGSSLLTGSEESSDSAETETSAGGSDVESENGSGLHLLVEIESNVDGTMPLGDVNMSEGVDEETIADADDSSDDLEEDADSPYEPGTIGAAPIDETTWGSRKFDKSSLTWSR